MCDLPKRYTGEEIAELYGVKRETVWSWIRDKKLRAIQLHDGRKDKYRIRAEDLEAFEQSRLTTKGADA